MREEIDMSKTKTVKLKVPTFKSDPIENSPKYRKILAQADKEAKEICKNHVGKLGYCHRFWAVKERILREKYGIEWKSPARMNPGVMFD